MSTSISKRNRTMFRAALGKIAIPPDNDRQHMTQPCQPVRASLLEPQRRAQP